MSYNIVKIAALSMSSGNTVVTYDWLSPNIRRFENCNENFRKNLVTR
jgi:hypothetical protein